VTPLNAFLLAEIIEEVGLPAGVFNLVTGTGPVVGEAIASHAEVDMVSFTGSTRAGKRVSELAAQTVKPVTCELGGKSPNIILEDANLEQAVADGVGKCFLNSGQTCSALTRMLVPRSRLAIMPYDDEDEAVRIANDTIYGLAAGVWSGDQEHAKEVARKIRSGQVEVNGGAFNPLAPFGGFKQSGHGRELGKFAVEEFLAVKSLQL